MYCAACGAEMDADAQFCDQCGKQSGVTLTLSCDCGASLRPGQRFCAKCGTDTAANEIKRKAQLEIERGLVELRKKISAIAPQGRPPNLLDWSVARLIGLQTTSFAFIRSDKQVFCRFLMIGSLDRAVAVHSIAIVLHESLRNDLPSEKALVVAFLADADALPLRELLFDMSHLRNPSVQAALRLLYQSLCAVFPAAVLVQVRLLQLCAWTLHSLFFFFFFLVCVEQASSRI